MERAKVCMIRISKKTLGVTRSRGDAMISRGAENKDYYINC